MSSIRFPTLSKEAVRVLDALLERSNLAGGELMRMADFKSPAELQAPAKELLNADLIQVGGDITSESRVPLATFGIRPSAKDYLRLVAQQNK